MSAIVEVENLEKTYPDGTQAVRGVSFTVEEGEFFGFLGPNGAGKSTTIKILITLLQATGGKALILGHDVAREAAVVRRLIGYAAQEVGVDDDLTGRENLVVQGRLYRLPKTVLHERVDELLALVDLTGDADRPAGSYSGGMRKRLDLAAGLIHRPRVLFLDEPTTGLDPQNRAGLWEYLERLNSRDGLTIFLTTHYLEEADRLANRVAIIDHGRIIALDRPAALKDTVGGGIIRLSFGGPNAAADRERAAGLLREFEGVSNVALEESTVVVTAPAAGRALPALLQSLDAAGLAVTEVGLAQPSLDDVFIKYTGERIREEAPVANWRNKRGGMFPMRPR